MRATPTSRKRPQKNHILGGCKHCNSHFFFFGLFCFFPPRKRKNPQVLEKERGYFDPARVGPVSADSSGSVSGPIGSWPCAMPAEPPAVVGERLGAWAVTWLQGGGAGGTASLPWSKAARGRARKCASPDPRGQAGRPSPCPGTDRQLAEVSPGVQVQVRGH